MVKELQKLLWLRKNKATGGQKDYFDHPNCIGWIREAADNEEAYAVVMCNGDAGFKTMEIGKQYAGKTFKDYLENNDADVVVNEEGFAEFHCSPGSVSVWVLV